MKSGIIQQLVSPVWENGVPVDYLSKKWERDGYGDLFLDGVCVMHTRAGEVGIAEVVLELIGRLCELRRASTPAPPRDKYLSSDERDAQAELEIERTATTIVWDHSRGGIPFDEIGRLAERTLWLFRQLQLARAEIQKLEVEAKKK